MYSVVYHLTNDPKQEKNVIDRYPDKAREMYQLFVQFMKETKVPASRL